MKWVVRGLILVSVLTGVLLVWNTPLYNAKIDRGMKTIIMPGLLVKGHKKEERNCAVCHLPFSKEVQDSLCLDCHTPIRKDIMGKMGFHGLSKEVQSNKCKDCHTDHKGRNFNIVPLNKDSFDHNLTDYPLKGAHVHQQCFQCHQPDKLYRDAPSECITCHEKDDAHRGTFGKDCVTCHNEGSWLQAATFDHSKTKFLLEGKHKPLVCKACHSSADYKNTPTNCIACHLMQDVHNSREMENCATCHNVETWKEMSFDHDTTEFKLEGRHDQLKCQDCHEALVFNNKIGTDCMDCHQSSDMHKGRFGPKCEDCHSMTEWKNARFDHDQDTEFPLKGKHKILACDTCHNEKDQASKLPTDCAACHSADDIHKGKLGKDCASCHNEQDWNNKVIFDHDVTDFPLIGMHAVTACGECHVTPDYKGVKKDCYSCHQPDDIHKLAFGQNCAQCHNSNSWNIWKFDHDTQSEFPLNGAHKGMACEACHNTPKMGKIEMAMDCASCHQKDDIHKGQFGSVERDCAVCHTEKDFKEILDNKIHDFHHLSIFKAQVLNNCAKCHAEDDVHKGRLGPHCDWCHSVDDFKVIKVRRQ